jgi:C-terminal processing protease CtpA/Prc
MGRPRRCRSSIALAHALAALGMAACTASSSVGSIGALLGRDGETGAVHVRGVPEGNAADKAGIEIGDEIVFVDGRDVRDLDVVELRKLLRGEPGSKVDLTLLRGGRVVRIRVERAPLVAPIPVTPQGEQKLEE